MVSTPVDDRVADLQQQLHEYQDTLPDEFPARLPPERQIDHLHNYDPGTRFGASPAGTDCDVCVSHLSFRFSSALELLWRYTTPPFLKYSFRRVMLQLDFRESKCKCEGSHLELSRKHQRSTRSVYAR